MLIFSRILKTIHFCRAYFLLIIKNSIKSGWIIHDALRDSEQPLPLQWTSPFKWFSYQNLPGRNKDFINVERGSSIHDEYMQHLS